VDTLKRVEGNRVLSTVDRAGLFAAATPQVFRADLLARAFAVAEDATDATDEAVLVEELGVTIVVVPVSRLSFKVTTPEDLEMAEALIRSRTPERGKRKAR
jgi:2-C-methyl-D-erythritol 4-phosphate cytidylyltransferase